MLHDALEGARFEPAHIVELAKYDHELNYLGPDDCARDLREACAVERRNVEQLGLLRAP